GTLTAQDGGFDAQIWDNSTYQDVKAALTIGGAPAKSPIIMRTVQRLALTIAPMPAPTDQAVWSLLGARLDVLAKIGDAQGHHALSARIPNDIAPLSILKKKADIALMVDDWPMACAAGAEGLSRTPTRTWTSLRLACRAGEGSRSAVDLLLDTTDASAMPSRAVRQAVEAVLAQTAGGQTDRPRQRQAVDQTTASPLLAALARLTGGAPDVAAPEVDVLSLEPLRISVLARSNALAAGRALASRAGAGLWRTLQRSCAAGIRHQRARQHAR
ncbi:MAG: hypothetical protein AAF337_12865, partial [Pseudomonadota bacterium]